MQSPTSGTEKHYAAVQAGVHLEKKINNNNKNSSFAEEDKVILGVNTSSISSVPLQQ